MPHRRVAQALSPALPRSLLSVSEASRPATEDEILHFVQDDLAMHPQSPPPLCASRVSFPSPLHVRGQTNPSERLLRCFSMTPAKTDGPVCRPEQAYRTEKIFRDLAGQAVTPEQQTRLLVVN